MPLAIALACAFAAAIAYGASTAAQHSAMEATRSLPSGRATLRVLLRSPRWMLGMGGDAVGLVLQVAALAVGPVVVVQPLLVLALPISLPIAWALGGPRPGRREYIGCGWIVGGLAVFFVLIGRPGEVRPAAAPGVLLAAAVAAGAGIVVMALVRRAEPAVTAAAYGGVAGCWFGLAAVLTEASAVVWSREGIAGFGRAAGLAPLLCLLVLGVAGIVLTQIAFRAGPLAAGFPANLVADPVTAVVVGAVLVHEAIPASAGHVAGYLAGGVAVLAGAVRLATAPAASVGPGAGRGGLP